VKDVEVGRGVGKGATVEVGDLWVSQLHEQSLCSLELVDGADVGLALPDLSLPGPGLAMLILLRKSV
jgi:hypothetical protein